MMLHDMIDDVNDKIITLQAYISGIDHVVGG